MQAFQVQGTVYTFLRPSFFQQVLALFGRRCPAASDDLFSGDASFFYRDYQAYILFSDFLRLYLGPTSLLSRSLPKETFDWN